MAAHSTSNLIIQTAHHALEVTVHAPSGSRRNVAILYFHGGGFLFGERDDLPAPYIGAITRAGYTLICIDYPLAPETPIASIVDETLHGVAGIARSLLPELGCGRYAVFGRSAGAYLALVVAARIGEVAPDLAQPIAVWDFYGYHSLSEPFVLEPSSHYRKLPAVSPETVANILRSKDSESITNGSKRERYALYVFARQNGSWADMLGVDKAEMALDLNDEDIARLPPLFVCASTSDNDVPFGMSKRLCKLAPIAHMHQVYYLEHDFDRDLSNPAGMDAYRDAISFLEEVLDSPSEGARSNAPHAIN